MPGLNHALRVALKSWLILGDSSLIDVFKFFFRKKIRARAVPVLFVLTLLECWCVTEEKWHLNKAY